LKTARSCSPAASVDGAELKVFEIARVETETETE